MTETQECLMNAETAMNQVLQGHCIDRMRELPDGCMDMGATSPPYWGLRDYGISPVDWPEVTFSPMPGLPPMTITAESSVHGLEKNIWAYVAHEVLVFREVRRVLADHGVLFLNLGDSYAANGGTGRQGKNGQRANRRHTQETLRGGLPDGLKPKDLCGIPWRVAYALQADGWYLRAWCPWVKRNPMPESADDRPTTQVEIIYVLSKCADYFWDAHAVKVHNGNNTHSRGTKLDPPKEGVVGHAGWMAYCPQGNVEGGRQRRSADWYFDTWQGLVLDSDGEPLAFVVNPKGTKDAHFATFSPKLVEPMILAGCPKEVCAVCGKPRERIVEKSRVATRPGKNTKIKVPSGWDTKAGAHGTIHREGRTEEPEYKEIVNRVHHPLEVGNRDPERHVTETQTVGWSDCGHNSYRPGRVLDPFGGSGTVGYVAAKLKRDWCLIEMNSKYVEDIAAYKLQEAEIGVPAEEAKNGQMALFGD